MSDERGRILDEFIEAACVPREEQHTSGTLDRANEILVSRPAIAAESVHAAAILGDDAAVRRFIAADPGAATAKGGPRGWDPLTHLCFSRYLARDSARSEGFVRAATALLDAGASANTGWWESSHQPRAEWESVLYGAAGIAHHPELTRLLVERGAEPDDGEVTYHAPESYDNRALEILVESGKLTAESLAVMLVRKCDWHDRDGIEWLLARGADPRLVTQWGTNALHHALSRDNSLAIIGALLDHGAEPRSRCHGRTAIALAARQGRGDVLALLEERGIPAALDGEDAILAACARGDEAAAMRAARDDPDAIAALRAEGSALLAAYATTGNAPGIELLLDLGVDVASPFEGNGYWGIPPRSLAIHVASWRGHSAAVKALIDRGSPVDARDGHGQTPLALAVRACTDSYWKERRTPDSVRALLETGASVEGVRIPTGYDAIDALLAAHPRLRGGRALVEPRDTRA